MVDGRSLDDDFFFEEPSELLGRSFEFAVSVLRAEVDLARHTVGVYCVFDAPFAAGKEKESTCKTAVAAGTLAPEFNAEFKVTLPKVTKEHLHWMETGVVNVRMFAKQASESMGGLSRLKKRAQTNPTAIDTPGAGAGLVDQAPKATAPDSHDAATQTESSEPTDGCALNGGTSATQASSTLDANDEAPMDGREDVAAALANVERENNQLSLQLQAASNVVQVRAVPDAGPWGCWSCGVWLAPDPPCP